ncbi:response regulator [Paenibacillus methanolicus]|uniref:YesN/AraC family two-component response regulator n=1 Tax=Paenibacillus methanolicus TaxID=582686 RepID=A0A5S5CG03_9BACL|nr:response regulator [Paenibacillus methanolicus]TYP77452.1 YesN/AraC family two-component response regulator [Paenibacillus methanolicus]
MKTIMIVDDEARQVKALSAIIRRLRPDYRTLEATDVKSAWELLTSEPVNAVLTDIRMPDEDGLTLAERIANQKPHIRTVLISGYGQFDYAQKAIEHRVIEYLIKPIGLADIERVIAKLEALFAQDNKHHALNKERFWHEIITDPLTDRKRQLIEHYAPSSGSGLAIVFELSGLSDGDRMAALKGNWTAESEALGHCETFQEVAGYRMASLVWLNPILAAKPSDTVTKISRILERVRADGFEDVSAGVSRVSPDFRLVVKEAYDEALLALRHRFYASEDAVFWRSDVQAFAERGITSAKEIAEPLAAAIKASERPRALDLVNAFFEPREVSPYPDPELIRDEVGHMVWQLLHSLQSLLPAHSPDWDHALLRKQFRHYRDYRELRLRFKEFVLRLLELAEKTQLDKNGLLILRCQHYLQQHYMEDISLESVAAMFHFNASYFSNLFKQRTGRNFSEYLLDLRINKAKLMLERSDEKIALISERSGFRTATYFNKMFKRETGISPKTFRQMHGGGAAK